MGRRAGRAYIVTVYTYMVLAWAGSPSGVCFRENWNLVVVCLVGWLVGWLTGWGFVGGRFPCVCLVA